MEERYTEKVGSFPVQTNLTKTEKAALVAYQERFGHRSLATTIGHILRCELEAVGLLGDRPARKG